MGAGEGGRLEGRMGIGIEEKEAKRDVRERWEMGLEGRMKRGM